MNILIAEDERATARALERTFGHAGYMTTVVSDGEAAIERAENELFDALVLDWMIPKLNGAELVRMVRRAFGHSAPYVLLLTGFVGQEEISELGREVGADFAVSKQEASPIEVVRLVNSALADRSRTQAEIDDALFPDVDAAA